ncbi:MAG TPA: hypothetical protein EYP85_17105 [Armatimonadetes bacterium]|nr:hypothetical protein [Armatimonadota bacterium]
MSKMYVKRMGQGEVLEGEPIGPEAELQKLIFDCPSLLPVEKLWDGESLIPLAMEFSVPAGSIDVLYVDLSGSIVIAEPKWGISREVWDEYVRRLNQLPIFQYEVEKVIGHCRASKGSIEELTSEQFSVLEETLKWFLTEADKAKSGGVTTE